MDGEDAGDESGTSVSLDGAGRTLAVGAPNNNGIDGEQDSNIFQNLSFPNVFLMFWIFCWAARAGPDPGFGLLWGTRFPPLRLA